MTDSEITRFEPSSGLEETTASSRPDQALPRGTTVGRYVIVDRAGAGGMGEVYVAYDPELDRRVAIKLLPTGTIGDQDSEGEARLLREARALARLEHPNIVSVYDAGTVDRSVFIAMEYVEGVTLRTWTAERPRPWRVVLDAYVRAGRGLAAAHAAGIVHRDFKPSNVMVRQDGAIRVLDFGLARRFGDIEEGGGEVVAAIRRSTGRHSQVDAALTRTGIVTGTPAYMAPEQLAGKDVDARGDQFSFCVALYEGLYGERPFAGRDLKEIARSVHASEVRDPPRGSPVPARVRRVILRGLVPDPNARFATMDDLLTALARAAPSPIRPLPVLAAGIVVAAVVGFVVLDRPPVCTGADDKMHGAWNDAHAQAVASAFATTGVPYADDVAASVGRTIDAWSDAWLAQRVDACEATRVRGEQSETAMDLRVACLDRRLARLVATVDLFERADATVVEKAVQTAATLDDPAGCADVRALQQAMPPPEDPEVAARVDALRAVLTEVEVLIEAGKAKDAVALAKPVVDEATALAYAPLAAEAWLTFSTAQISAGDATGAEPSAVEALLAAEAAGHDEIELRARISLIVVTGQLLSRHADADQHTRHADALAQRVAIPPRGAGALASAHSLTRFSAGDYDAAHAWAERALSERAAVLGPDHPAVASLLMNLGSVEVMRGNHEAGLAAFERGLAINRGAMGDRHPLVGHAHHNMGTALIRLGRLDEAEDAIRTALTIWSAALPAQHPDLARAQQNLAVIFVRVGRHDDAREACEKALAIKRAALGEDHPSTALTASNLADILNEESRFDEAFALSEHARSVTEKKLGPKHPALAAMLATRGEAELGLGRAHDALASLEASIAIYGEQVNDPIDIADVHFTLARALWAVGKDRARALELARSARDVYAPLPALAGRRKTIDAWLAANAP